jgi:hypothetical protein
MEASALLLKNGADPQIRAYTLLMETTDPAPLDFLLQHQPPTLATQKEMFIECLRLKSELAITRLKDRGLLDALTDDETVHYLRQQAIPVQSPLIKAFAFSLLDDINQRQQKQKDKQQAMADEQRTARLLSRSAAKSPVQLRRKKRAP